METLKEKELRLVQLETDLKATKQLIDDNEDAVAKHKRSITELMLEVRYNHSKYDDLYMQAKTLYNTISTQKLAIEKKLQDRKLEELVKAQPDFYVALEKKLETIAIDRASGIELTMENPFVVEDAVEKIKTIDDDKYGLPAAMVLAEAKSDYLRLLSEVCQDQMKSGAIDLNKKNRLEIPIQRFLKHPTISSTLGL